MNAPAKAMPAHLGDIVGAANVVEDPARLALYEVDGLSPTAAARPGTPEETAELAKLAAAENLAVIPTGARTKLGIGMPPARYDLAIDMTRLDRVVSYDPGDLTLSVEAGIPLAKLASVLVEHKQFLPLAVPFYDRATVGGTLASGVDSPLRQAYGTTRDFVLGMEFVAGEGALTKSGGRVVKNVSGYDLHKLMLGSLGSLGVITRVNFKTFPLPGQPRTWLASFLRGGDAFAFVQQVRRSPFTPLSLEVFERKPSAVLLASPLPGNAEFIAAVSLAGNDTVLARCAHDLEALAHAANGSAFTALDESASSELARQIREFLVLSAEQSPSAAILRISALPSQMSETCHRLQTIAEEVGLPYAILARGVGIIYFALLPSARDAAAPPHLAQCAKKIFSAAESAGQQATMPFCSPELKREINIWGSPRADFPLMQRVKQAFDPHGLFAPGRFVGGL